MKIVWCHIENFGKLSDLHLDFSNGMNEICRENGWGKTTLMSFLRIMLYGFEGDKKRNALENERSRYMPWQGGVYGGTMCFEANGRQYVMTRIFGKKESEDTFELRDSMTNMPSQDFSKHVGEELFGINSEGFQNSVFIGQGHGFSKVNDSIHAKLNEQATMVTDVEQYEKANKQIADALNHMSDRRVTGELYKLNDRLTTCKTNLQALGDAKGQLQSELAKANQRAEKLEAIDSYINKDKELQRLLMEQAVVQDLSMETKQDENNSTSSNHKTMGIACILVGVVLLVLSHLFLKSFLVLAIILAIICWGLAIYLMGKKPQKSDRQESFISQITSGEGERIDQYTEEIGRFLAGFGIECSVDDYMKKLMELKLSNHGVDDALYDKCAEQERLMTEISELQSEIEKKTETYEALRITQKYLQSAKEAFSAKYAGPLREQFGKYYQMATGEDLLAHLDADFKLTVDEQGMQRDAMLFSKGNQDLFDFCLRLAMVDAMYTGEKPVLFMDDPFVNLDEKRLLGVQKIMKNLTSDYQVFYFTCRGVGNL